MHERIALRRADVVSLQSGRRRQHDVGVTRGRRPPRLVHDDGLRPAEGGAQLVGVLVMVERIAARPVHQLDVRIRAVAAIEVVRLAGMQQALRDPRRRNGAVERVGRGLHARRAERRRRLGDAGRGAVTEAEAAARQADLAETGSEQQHRPIGLLAVIGALDRPRGADHGAVCRHAPRQRANGFGGNAGDRRRPVGVLRPAVAFAHDIGAHALEAGAVAREEIFIVQPVRDQRMGQRQEHRGIGAGPDRNPFRRHRGRAILADRADIDDRDAGAGELRKRLADGVRAHAAFGHLHVLRIGAAEHHHQPCVARDRRP